MVSFLVHLFISPLSYGSAADYDTLIHDIYVFVLFTFSGFPFHLSTSLSCYVSSAFELPSQKISLIPFPLLLIDVLSTLSLLASPPYTLLPSQSLH